HKSLLLSLPIFCLPFRSLLFVTPQRLLFATPQPFICHSAAQRRNLLFIRTTKIYPLGGNTIKTTAKTTATAKADSSATLRNDKQKRGNSSVTKQRVYVDTA
ncbi:MAG: hypothetical protein P4K80_09370, partial [Acidobacteriaceae bacterium]|nr:hypothetical protein [Acidobacteriaceae bacterium]